MNQSVGFYVCDLIFCSCCDWFLLWNVSYSCYQNLSSVDHVKFLFKNNLICHRCKFLLANDSLRIVIVVIFISCMKSIYKWIHNIHSVLWDVHANKINHVMLVLKFVVKWVWMSSYCMLAIGVAICAVSLVQSYTPQICCN